MTEIQGDLLEIKEGIIFHQVNAAGVTGGLAGALRRKWPYAFTAYEEVCDESESNPLGLCLFGCDGKVWVGHVFGQVRPGPNTDMEAVHSALSMAQRRVRHPDLIKLPTYFPYKMGCGLGGGNWDKYRAVIEKYFPNAIIVRKPGYD